MLAPIRGQLAEDSGCFPTHRCSTPTESRRTPRSRGPWEDLARISAPRTSRCHPGCFSPELQDQPDVNFHRLPAAAQQAMASPRGHAERAWALREDLDPLDRSGAASAPPILAEVEVPQRPDTPAFVRLPPELKEALKVLGRPHAPWPAELCREVRRKAAERPGAEEASLLQKLQQCVLQATETTFKRGCYQVEDSDRQGRAIAMFVVRPLSILVHWSKTRCLEVRDVGKAVVPPLLIADLSCLDVVARLRSWGLSRKIVVVTELLEFDQTGCARFGVASQRPHCMALRSDFRRFQRQAELQQKRQKSTMQRTLCDWKMPQVFVAKDVTCIRGPQGDGYPFLLRPFQCDVLGMALWTDRPRLRNERDEKGELITVYSDADDAKAYELRLEMCALAALEEGTDVDSSEQPVLVLPVIGLGGNSFHPQDSVVLALKSFRRRFTQYFHSVYVCCGDRGPNYALSDFIESAVNRSVYMMAHNDTLAAKALPWHWDQREIQLSIAAARLEKIGHHMRQGPTYVVSIEEDRRTSERKQLVEKHHSANFGSLRAYYQRKQIEAAQEIIKAQRRQGDWPADLTHVKLGGLRDNLELSPEFANMDLRKRRASELLNKSLSKVQDELDDPRPPRSDLSTLQDMMVSVRTSAKTRGFCGWLSKADNVARHMGCGQLLLEAKRRSRQTSLSLEDDDWTASSGNVPSDVFPRANQCASVVQLFLLRASRENQFALKTLHFVLLVWIRRLSPAMTCSWPTDAKGAWKF
ncbi:unnamed protein product [Effrenium voratum]|uniref:Uncharacterized protein n=1 Tax=Effrenium voratum TaxID=2562239 RepID=A0AA36ND42_9DINO|nr:unnamed protein product [Effrenium voratum]